MRLSAVLGSRSSVRISTMPFFEKQCIVFGLA